MNYDNIITDLSNILKTKHTVGIFVSGGFDSTVLSFTLHELREELKTNNVFKFFTVPRFEDSWIHAKRIINSIDEHFAQSPSAHYLVGNPFLKHQDQVSSGFQYIMKYIETTEKFKADTYIFSDTLNPASLPNGPERNKAPSPLIQQPFFNYTKDETVNIMIQRNLYHIMDLTHTCTNSKLLRCAKCWQCSERAWAFSKCGIKDTGTM
jgi:tRNA(Ile)-lysidine synthase TilS/MesJ